MPGGTGGPGGDNVVDAEFEEVDPKKKKPQLKPSMARRLHEFRARLNDARPFFFARGAVPRAFQFACTKLPKIRPKGRLGTNGRRGGRILPLGTRLGHGKT